MPGSRSENPASEIMLLTVLDPSCQHIAQGAFGLCDRQRNSRYRHGESNAGKP